jgi:hypothetical protein
MYKVAQDISIKRTMGGELERKEQELATTI